MMPSPGRCFVVGSPQSQANNCVLQCPSVATCNPLQTTGGFVFSLSAEVRYPRIPALFDKWFIFAFFWDDTYRRSSVCPRYRDQGEAALAQLRRANHLCMSRYDPSARHHWRPRKYREGGGGEAPCFCMTVPNNVDMLSKNGQNPFRLQRTLGCPRWHRAPGYQARRALRRRDSAPLSALHAADEICIVFLLDLVLCLRKPDKDYRSGFRSRYGRRIRWGRLKSRPTLGLICIETIITHLA